MHPPGSYGTTQYDDAVKAVKSGSKTLMLSICHQKRTEANLNKELNISLCPNFNSIILCVYYSCVLITFNYKEKVTFTVDN